MYVHADVHGLRPELATCMFMLTCMDLDPFCFSSCYYVNGLATYIGEPYDNSSDCLLT